MTLDELMWEISYRISNIEAKNYRKGIEPRIYELETGMVR